MLIVGVDTSCDETSVAVLENRKVLSNIISSQINIHKEWGGVVPHLAKRAHAQMIEPVFEKAIKRASLKLSDIDVLAVTKGPGLSPALEIGVNYIKQLALKYHKPIVAVNHMEGHIYSNFLLNKNGRSYSNLNKYEFPALALLISGGHTQLVLMNGHGVYQNIGSTLDDAAGEAFDKVSRMLGLGYPGGPIIEFMAKNGNPGKYNLPRPMRYSKDYNFSFSGLKTAALYEIRELKEKFKNQFYTIISDYCASFQEAVIDILLIKTVKAVQNYNPAIVLLAGGVSANKRLRFKFRKTLKNYKVKLYLPRIDMCTDNAAMIAIVGYYKAKNKEFVRNVNTLDRNPILTLNN